MTAVCRDVLPACSAWVWPIDPMQYDQTPRLSFDETQDLTLFTNPKRLHRAYVLAQAERTAVLDRLLRPLRDVFAVIDSAETDKLNGMYLLLRACAREGTTFWGWDSSIWLQVLGSSRQAFFTYHLPGNATEFRQFLIAAAYLLHCVRDVRGLGGIEVEFLAQKIFGRTQLDTVLQPLVNVTTSWGYSERSTAAFRSIVSLLFLLNGSSDPHILTRTFLAEMHAAFASDSQRRGYIYRLSRVLAHFDIIEAPLPLGGGITPATYQAERERDVAPAWIAWAEHWHATSTRSRSTRNSTRLDLLRVGRWLAVHHPQITSPNDWTREVAAECVAAVSNMRTGDLSYSIVNIPGERGVPWSPQRKHALLGVLRRTFMDAQEWGWSERRFNPQRVFATPRTLKQRIGPHPRIIADDVWAKLLWAGLNLQAEDVPVQGWTYRNQPVERDPDAQSFYPIEMLRALAILWLFAGLRSDELSRLRVGCARMQVVYPESGIASAENTMDRSVCLLDIPVHKTGRAFTKPVDPVIAEAIAAWEAVRPVQPDLCDSKTGEAVQLLFCFRAKPFAKSYLNKSLIPALCAKAGIPRSDARGSISSHRARSTIANQLFNAREPMGLFELQAWLGHQSPATTQHYVVASPTKLARAYQDTNYFARNVRAIEVLIDRDAITSGVAAQGTPWHYYDLGHGYCTYEFFDQCPHRMACAKCAFYLPKASSQAQLLEAKANLQRMLQEIPLTEEERCAVEDGVAAVEKLSTQLMDIPTPAGPTPRQLAAWSEHMIALDA